MNHNISGAVHPRGVMGKRIAFVLNNYPLGVSTMLINSIALLAKCNVVDVFVSAAEKGDRPCDPWLEPHLVMYPSFHRVFLLRLVRFLNNKLTSLLRLPSSRLGWYLSNLDLLLFSRWLKKATAEPHYDIFIAVECYSLIAVHLARPAAADIIYYNMELLDWSEADNQHRNKSALKRLEHDALGDVTHVMITSPERARIFTEINSFPAQNVSALPVLPLGTATARHSDFFRRQFGIAEDRLVVLYSGNFQPWAQCLEIIESMSGWPDNAVLVMHTWNKAARGSDYFRRMVEAAERRPVFFSSEYILHQDLPTALASADIGLLFYEAIDSNFTEILFSSNKMAEYMVANLPVICSPFPSLKEFVSREGIGQACGIADIGAAISEIARDRDGYAARVAECRRRHFQFEPYFDAAFAAYARHAGKQFAHHASL